MSKFCKNMDELRDAIREYRVLLTPEKCARVIGTLNEVKTCKSNKVESNGN
jgi:hypothetical protein